MRIRFLVAALALVAAVPMQVSAASRKAGMQGRRKPPVEAATRHLRFASSPSLTADPLAPVAGAPVTLRVRGAYHGPADYRWDFSGHGVYRLDTGPIAEAQVRFETLGIHVVSVKVANGGSIQRLSLTVIVIPRGVTAPVAMRRPGRAAPQTRPVPRQAPARPRAHLAADPGVTIVDFKFVPGTTTIHAGDTITWTNSGPSPHTATANDQSFDTGVLHKGQTAAHTFTRSGTFSYFCTIHPFMHGRITVLPASSSPSGSGSGGRSSSTPGPSGSSTNPTASTGTASAPRGSSGALPFTGLNLVAVVLCGCLLIGSGAALRRWAQATRGTASAD